MGIVKSLFSRNESKQNDSGQEQESAAQAGQAASLLMLQPDAAGIATYQMHTFAEAGEAETYLDSTTRGSLRDGTIMFWALTWRPLEADGAVEPLVVIRDGRRGGLVYTFSFADLESAYGFVRHEMTAGLDLGQVAVYWAVPAKPEVDYWGKVNVTPQEPPQREARVVLEAADAVAGAAANAVVPEMEATAESGEAVAVLAGGGAEAMQPNREEPDSVPLRDVNGGRPDEPGQRAIDGTDVSDFARILEAKGLRAPRAGETDGRIEEEKDEEEYDEAIAGENARGDAEEEETTHSAIEGADLSNVVRILEAKGLRAPANLPRPADPEDEQVEELEEEAGAEEAEVAFKAGQPEAAEEAGGEVEDHSENGNGRARVEDETMHVHLSDVFGEAARVIKSTDREALKALGGPDGEDEQAETYANGANGLSAVEAAESAEGAESPAVAAWSNIALAIDEALDAHVARKVVATICWRRLTRAFVLARRARLIVCWRAVSKAIGEAAKMQAAKEKAKRDAWSNAARALQKAAEVVSGRRGLRLAWMNIAWTLEEAAFAARLARKATYGRAWEVVSIAMAQAVKRKFAMEAGMRSAWATLSREIVEGAEAQEAHHVRVVEAWAAASEAIVAGVEEMSRRERVFFAWESTGLALAAYALEKVRHDSLVKSWKILAFEIIEAAVTQRAHHRKLVRAWKAGTYAIAEGVEEMFRRERVFFAWESTGLALAAYAREKARHDGVVASWERVSAGVSEAAETLLRQRGLERAWRLLALELLVAADLQVRRDQAAAAWLNASEALSAAAAEKLRIDGLRAAWKAAGKALRAYCKRQRRHEGFVAAWRKLSVAFVSGAEAQVRHEALVFAWVNIGRAMRNAGQAKAVRLMSHRQSWTRLTTALAEAHGRKLRHLAAKAAWSAARVALGAAIEAKAYRDTCEQTWQAIADAIGEALPLELRRQGNIAAWENAMLALNEAGVAEAQVRIAQAGLDDKLMKGIRKAIRSTKGRKVATEAGKAAEEALKVAKGAKVAPAAPEAEETNNKKSKGSTKVKKSSKKGAKDEGRNGSEDKQAEEVDNAAAIEMWRFREGGRFKEKKEDPFDGFESPPGRF